MSRKQQMILWRIACSAVLMGAGLITGFALSFLPAISLCFYLAAAVIVGYDVVIAAVNGLVHGHMLDENFLMTIGSVGAFVLGEWAEGTFILLLYQVGELFQAIAVGKSRKSIAELMDIRPDYANIEQDGKVVQVDPYDVHIGDIILIEPGEKVPLDGEILSGNSTVDTSSLTGESLPREVHAGDRIISGSINLTSPLKVRVVTEFEESTVSKILELAENASSRKAKAENFVTTFAKYYTPCVVAAALLTAILPPLLFAQSFSAWILRAVMFVVISCPCALVVSVPLAFFGALGGASRIGVLVKGSNYLEALAQTDTVLFDKTGTLTKGSFKVSGYHPALGITEDELLKTAAICEQHSSHPIALSIKSAYTGEIPETDSVQIIAGKGVQAVSGGKTLLAGNAEFLRQEGYEPVETDSSATAVHIADGRYLGTILIEDEIKDGSREAVSQLKAKRVSRTVMLTGDRKQTAEKIGRELGIDEIYAELLPADKVELTEIILEKADGKVAFVGDGVNDAPVLARADVGIAMGGLGSDAAIEAADIVIMNDDLRLLPKAVDLARKALRISKQNIAFALIVKFSILGLSFFGLSTIWYAVFADVGVLILAILNSMRTLKR